MLRQDWVKFVGAHQVCVHGFEQPDADFPALGRICLLGRGDVLDLDLLGSERLREGGGRQDCVHIVCQRCGRHRADVEVDVLRVTNAAAEETEIAAALDREQRLVHAAPQLGDKDEME